MGGEREPRRGEGAIADGGAGGEALQYLVPASACKTLCTRVRQFALRVAARRAQRGLPGAAGGRCRLLGLRSPLASARLSLGRPLAGVQRSARRPRPRRPSLRFEALRPVRGWPPLPRRTRTRRKGGAHTARPKKRAAAPQRREKGRPPRKTPPVGWPERVPFDCTYGVDGCARTRPCERTCPDVCIQRLP